MISFYSIFIYIFVVIFIVIMKIEPLYMFLASHRGIIGVIIFIFISYQEMRNTKSPSSYSMARSIFIFMIFTGFFVSTIILTDFQIAKWDIDTYLENDRNRTTLIDLKTT